MKQNIFITLTFCLISNLAFTQKQLVVSNIQTASGKTYQVNNILSGEKQYMDRDYQYNYIPIELQGSIHIKTCGNDKLISEDDTCLSFEVNKDVDVYILYADKFPDVPNWLNDFKRTRFNITRIDSDSKNLKGYFSLYHKSFKKGKITLNGCSSNKMLKQEGFIESMGSGYCMYSLIIK